MVRSIPRLTALLGIVTIIAGLAPLATHANGGQVRIADYPLGPYTVTVFTSPVPLTTGTVDVSVLLQDRETKAIVDGATISLTVTPASGGPPQQYAVTREQATNPLYYAAEFPITEPGRYHLQLDIRGPAGSGSVTFEVTVELGRSSWLQSWWLWGGAALVILAILWWFFAGGERRSPSATTARARGRQR